jgi:hypothetical protein
VKGNVNGKVEYRLEREWVLTQHEVRILGEKIERFTHSLSEAEQLLLEWLFARASTASQPNVPEVGGYTYTGLSLPFVGWPEAEILGGGDVRAASDVPPLEAEAVRALCVGKYMRIADGDQDALPNPPAPFPGKGGGDA